VERTTTAHEFARVGLGTELHPRVARRIEEAIATGEAGVPLGPVDLDAVGGEADPDFVAAIGQHRHFALVAREVADDRLAPACLEFEFEMAARRIQCLCARGRGHKSQAQAIASPARHAACRIPRPAPTLAPVLRVTATRTR
jgi:hypothetical protein